MSVIFYETYPRIEVMNTGQNKFQKNQYKRRGIHEKPKRVKSHTHTHTHTHRERDSAIIKTITMVILWYAKVCVLN